MKTKPIIIKDRINKNGQSKIYIRYSHKDRFVLIPTNDLYVNPKDFNSNGFVKKTDVNHELKNNLIQRYILDIERIVLELRLKNIQPTIKNVKNQYLYNDIFDKPIEKITDNKEVIKVGEKTTDTKDIDFFKEWENLTEKRYRIKEITLRTYMGINYSIDILKKFSNHKQYPINFNTINKTFLDKLLDYLYNIKGFSNGSVDNVLKNLKVYMKYGFENNYHINNEYTTFKRVKKDGSIITLTYQEIQKIFDYKPINQSEELTKDISILMLNTGLRYSDIQQLNKSHFSINYLDGIKKYSSIHSFISITTTKNKIPIKIPFNDGVYYIYEKYYKNGLTFENVSNKVFNERLKKLTKKVGINSEVETYIFMGKQKVVKTYPKYDIMSSHILRKTFISISLSENNTDVVMSLIGSKDYKSFKRYVNMSVDSKRGVMDTINMINGSLND